MDFFFCDFGIFVGVRPKGRIFYFFRVSDVWPLTHSKYFLFWETNKNSGVKKKIPEKKRKLREKKILLEKKKKAEGKSFDFRVWFMSALAKGP